ncbi:Hypothetical predicted protein [Pelobates cultripes]|uniref:Uncharacterized protein n=1 Tax=Pelobates cultripes TaxID=61616 RepID=A0AAD1SSH8_PELCU|nr:Hypothetical predicted protein [Pelobates cultripes]
MDYHQLRDDIRNYSLDDCARGNQGYNRVLLQLFGYTGHGKSSFINSCKFVLTGEYRTIAEAGERASGATTFMRRPYELTDTITIVDNRGFGTMNSYEKLQIYCQLGNFLPLNRNVEWIRDYNSLMENLENSDFDPNYTDLIVPLFIYSGRRNLAQGQHLESSRKQVPRDIGVVIRGAQACTQMTGIVPIIVLTNKARGDFRELEMKFKDLGAEVVYDVENYTTEEHQRIDTTDTDILNIMYNALEDVKFHMEQIRDPKQERIDHKIFLLNMAHECVQQDKIEAKRQEDIRRQEEERRRKEDRRKQEEEGRRQEEEGRRQEEIRRQEEERKRQEDMSSKRPGKNRKCLIL